MEINKIKILDYKTQIENDIFSEEIIQEFTHRNILKVDNTFVFDSRIYLVKKIDLNFENGKCDVFVYLELLTSEEENKEIVAKGVRKLSNSFSGALRTFAYFMASGTQYTLNGIDYISLYGEEPSAIEMVFAIYTNVIELDEQGNVLNAKYAEKRATDSLRAYCDPNFIVEPPYADWETALY